MKVRYLVGIVLMAFLCFGSIDATAQRPIRRGERQQTQTQQTRPAKPSKEQQYQKDLKAGEKLFDQKKFSEAKMHFAKMLPKYQNHKADINSWIEACDAMLGDVAEGIQVQQTKMQTETQSQQSSQATSGYINGHEWVDLGLPLGLKWATCNVGASLPEEYGSYFAWGNTNPSACRDTQMDVDSRSTIGDISGNFEYDAARANWGGSWRMPTQAEFEELLTNCREEWITYEGHYGCKLTSRRNGKSIFFPAGGCYYNGSSISEYDEVGYYWHSTKVEDNFFFASYTVLEPKELCRCLVDVSCPMNIRPVTY